MRSAANLKGHPIHPMLIPFPFAFLYGSVAFDLLGRVRRRPDWCRAGAALQTAGLATGAVAALPGLADYLLTVPPDSSGKRRATRHLLANLSALALFAAARAFGRRRDTRGPSAAAIALEAAGAALLGAGGWLGGTLVYRNEIGVDVRQAGAGRWRESRARLEPGQQLFVAGRSDELGVDQMKLVHVNGRRVVVARTAAGFVAFDDRCTHRGGSLAGGALVNGVVQCPWHGSQFDVGSGRAARGPAETAIRTYRVEERDGALVVHL